MSLDIYLVDTTNGSDEGEEVRSMNWLRNPFGLERWAEANYRYALRDAKSPSVSPGSLWDVVNGSAYHDSDKVDRPRFLAVVREYQRVISAMSQAYFWFDVGAFLSFVEPHIRLMPVEPTGFGEGTWIKGMVYFEKEAGLPMELFGDSAFHLSDRYRPDAHTFTRYKAWLAELDEFAVLLQDERYRYYCSN